MHRLTSVRLAATSGLAAVSLLTWLTSIKHWPRANDFTNELGLQMVWCAPGRFVMGSPASEPGRDKDETLQETEIPAGFWIGRFEVTQGQWERLMPENPSRFHDRTVLWRFTLKNSSHPVERLSWEDASEYCRRLTRAEKAAKTLPEGYVYTLPTSAQWEYACRAGTKTAYAYGDTLTPALAAIQSEASKPVGSFRPNAWGIYDMHGNVWEWCRDSYPAIEEERIFRGGCWRSDPVTCRSAFKGGLTPQSSDHGLGFRVALVRVDS